VSFVGTLDPPLNPQRPRFLEEFQAYQQLYLDQGDYVPVFCRSQLVLNQSVVGELNFRLFQAMACGAAVLTEDVFNGLKSLFMPEEEVFIYPQNNARAAARQAQQALADPVRLQAVARAGRRKTLKEHTATVRAKKILSLAQELAGSGLRQFRLQSQAIIREHLAQTFFFLATDEQLAIPAEMRQVYLDIGLSYRA
jgi:glycosyltransferase involved in cell wall biosynthesis